MLYSQLFTKSDNTTLLKEGDLLKRPELAQTLKEIAKRTPDDAVKYFYNSEFTDALVTDINDYAGNMTKEDFVNYEVLEYDALVSEFGQLRVLGTPAPSSGSILMFILNILKGLWVQINNCDRLWNKFFDTKFCKWYFLSDIDLL